MAEILIVEDDADAAEALTEVMRMEGHEVRVGYNGAEGLRLLEQRIPDLLLLDVDMPILNGPGMAHRMIVHNAGLERIPIILLSGAPELTAIAAAVGTPYYLAKPCRYEQLVSMLGSALRERLAPGVAAARE